MTQVSLDVRSNIDRVVAEFKATTSGKVRKATYRALNRALDKAATETSRQIRKIYNVRDRAVKRAMKKRRAHAKSLFARLTIEGARIGLIEFSARQTKPGVTVQIRKDGGRKLVKSAFINTRRWRSWQDGAEQSHRGVFRRVGKERYPIRYLRSVSIPQQFANKAVLEAIQSIAVMTFEKNFEQQMGYLHLSGKIP